MQSSIVYSAIAGESLIIARASNNPKSFSTAIKSLIARMSRQGVFIEKLKSVILKLFNKHQGISIILVKVSNKNKNQIRKEEKRKIKIKLKVNK